MFFMFLMTVVTLPGQSDTYRFYHKVYTTDDGLSSRYIQDIYQDSRNFIWVSSDYGVNRFDGQKFKVYNQGKYKLSTDNINQIREDKRGNLWFISRTPIWENGVRYWSKITVDILDNDKDEIVSLEEYIGKDLPFEWSTVVRIDQDESYVLWLTTKEGKVYRYTDEFIEYPIGAHLKDGGVIYPLLDSGLLILGPGKIIKLNTNGTLVYELDATIGVKKVFSTTTGQIFLISDKRLLYQIDNKGHLSLYEGDVAEPGQKLETKRFGIDSRSRLWVQGLDDKISLYEKGDLILNAELERFNLKESGTGRISFVGDKSGGIWYSDVNGLNYISLNKSGFTPYMNNSNVSMRGLFKLTDSTFFVNTYSGYFALNKNTGYFETYEVQKFTNFSQDGILLNGYLYNSTYAPEVVKIDIETRTANFIKISVDDRSLNSKTFIRSPDSMILIGANIGLFVLNPALDSILPFKQYNEFKELKNLIINNFNEVDGQVYISTANGLFVLDWEKGIVAHHKFDFNHLLYLYQDKEGIKWIATRGGGLLEWHPENENLTRQYTVDDGLSHDIIYAVYEDATNHLWLPSSKGLMCFDKKDKTIITYFNKNGLTNNEFNQYAHFQDIDGTIYLGGVNGLVAFDPSNIRRFPASDSDSRIVVTEIKLTRTDNKIYDHPINAINKGETLVVKGDVQSANIRFSLLEYDRLKSSQYYYKVAGIHDKWQRMNDQYISINGLPGGTHNILIKVHAGIKMKTFYSTIKVQILKPFTHTWLFFSICALGFLALGISLSRYRIYRLDQINRSLERKVKRRTKKIEDDKILISQQYHEMEQINKTKDHLIAIIGHDLKDYVSTFEGIEKKINYLISSKQIERIPQLVEFIENSAHDLSLLLDNLLNWALKERGDLLLHPDSVKVDSILTDVLKRLDKSISQKEIVLISKIPEDLIMYVDGLTLHSLLRNIIHNAIKFSYRRGIVKIYHTEKDDFVILHIRDNGIGIEQEQLDQFLTDTIAATSTRGTENEIGTGMGLLLCREMLEMQSGKLNVSSKVGEGTTFSILLPKQTSATKVEEIGV